MEKTRQSCQEPLHAKVNSPSLFDKLSDADFSGTGLCHAEARVKEQEPLKLKGPSYGGVPAGGGA